MALLTTASAANRVVDTALQITYSRRLISGQWVAVTGTVPTTYRTAWEYTRNAVKTYRYIGMTESAARTKAAALVALYTRATTISDWDDTHGEFDDVSAGDLLMADVVPQHEDGDAWSVVVSVREQDARTSLLGNLSPAAIFAAENSRDYEEDDDED